MSIFVRFFGLVTPVRLGWIILIAFVVFGADTLLRASSKSVSASSYPISHIEWQYDTYEQLTIDDVINTPTSSWTQLEGPVNFGIKRGAHWLKIKLPPDDHKNEQRLLEIAYPSLDELQLWFFSHANPTSPSQAFRYGDKQPFSERSLAYESFIVNFADFEHSPDHLIMRVSTAGSVKIPLKLWQLDDFIAHSAAQRLAIGILFGFLLAMAVSNLFFYLTTENHTFLLYALHVVSFCFVVATLFGYGFAYIWPENTGFQQKAMSVFVNATMFFVVLFSEHILKLRELSLIQSRLTRILAGVFLLNIFSTTLLHPYYSIQIFFVCMLAAVVYIFALCVWYTIKKVRIAKYYAIAWFLLLSCAITASPTS